MAVAESCIGARFCVRREGAVEKAVTPPPPAAPPAMVAAMNRATTLVVGSIISQRASALDST